MEVDPPEVDPPVTAMTSPLVDGAGVDDPDASVASELSVRAVSGRSGLRLAPPDVEGVGKTAGECASASSSEDSSW